MATVVKIKNEESILNILFEEKTIVEPSLRRLLDMKNYISGFFSEIHTCYHYKLTINYTKICKF